MSAIQLVPDVPSEDAARQAHFDKLAYELGDLKNWKKFQLDKAEAALPGVKAMLKIGKKLVQVRQISEDTVLMPDGSARNMMKVKMRKKDRMRQRHANARKALFGVIFFPGCMRVFFAGAFTKISPRMVLMS